MCGIAGCYRWDRGHELTVTMSDRLAHSGPDGDGLTCFTHDGADVHLAHRRLSIIDPSPTGAQPFSKGGLTIACNGELYNFRELAAELGRSGVEFRSACDTEVVLEVYLVGRSERPHTDRHSSASR